MRNISGLIFIQMLIFVSVVNANPWDIKKGKKVYLNNCTACHGPAGDGRGPASVAIPGAKPRNFLQEDFKFGESKEEIFNTITKGIEGSAMPPWNSLSVSDRKAVSAYIYSLRPKH